MTVYILLVNGHVIAVARNEEPVRQIEGALIEAGIDIDSIAVTKANVIQV